MTVASKTWSVAEIVTAANMNTYLRDNLADLQTNKDVMESGTYEGNGEESYEISLSNTTMVITYLRVWERETVDATTLNVYVTTPDIMDDNAAGGCIQTTGLGAHTFRRNKLIALGTGSFTVDDGGGDTPPNKDGHVYNYLAIGTG
jgi:hypothetical protein